MWLRDTLSAAQQSLQEQRYANTWQKLTRHLNEAELGAGENQGCPVLGRPLRGSKKVRASRPSYLGKLTRLGWDVLVLGHCHSRPGPHELATRHEGQSSKRSIYQLASP